MQTRALIYLCNELYGDKFTTPGPRRSACCMLMCVFPHYIAIRTLITPGIDFAFGCRAVYVAVCIVTHYMCI